MDLDSAQQIAALEARLATKTEREMVHTFFVLVAEKRRYETKEPNLIGRMRYHALAAHCRRHLLLTRSNGESERA